MGRLIDDWREKQKLPPLKEDLTPKDHVVLVPVPALTFWQKLKKVLKR